MSSNRAPASDPTPSGGSKLSANAHKFFQRLTVVRFTSSHVHPLASYGHVRSTFSFKHEAGQHAPVKLSAAILPLTFAAAFRNVFSECV
ncbi:unnamed protein product [Colias eurytheme]|nr:unnamed protein product [Colias eurytheme]